ncbi:unnamed protein product, partial [Clonostachys rosea f. rosea IK726]
MLRWAEVNSGSVEVIAGQHRIAALREFIRDSAARRMSYSGPASSTTKVRFPPTPETGIKSYRSLRG